MARTSRKGILQISEHKQSQLWNTAIYTRLSIEDNGQNADESISNQETLLNTFVKSYSDLKLIKSYTDNGETGTNFMRPAWENLMDDIKKQTVNCIVVKDLSRLGRNYIEAGDYLERVFPFISIRFIAINDRYDSEKILFQDSGMEVPLRNLINDFYAKDISKKVKSALEMKKKRGEFIGSSAPYGYLLKNNHLYPDPETKTVVKRIFSLKNEAITNYEIAAVLNRATIPCPSRHKCERGDKRYQKYADALWQPQAIERILRDEVYIGNTIHRYNCSLYSSHPRKMKQENWQRIENTHEQLIEKGLFIHVNEITKRGNEYRNEMKKIENPAYPDVLQGILKCGICGSSIRRDKDIKTKKGKKIAKYYYYCATKYAHENAECNHKRVIDKRIHEIILRQITLQVGLIAKADEMIENLAKEKNNQAGMERWNKIRDIEQEIKRFPIANSDLYEEMKAGKFTKSEYTYKKKQIKEKQKELLLVHQQLSINKHLQKCQKNQTEEQKLWMNKYKKFIGAKCLNREMVVELLDKVEVYNNNSIKITYKFKNEFDSIMSTIAAYGGLQNVI
jgi:DNA invertase Pin-like site-specific DNA recombinase